MCDVDRRAFEVVSVCGVGQRVFGAIRFFGSSDEGYGEQATWLLEVWLRSYSDEGGGREDGGDAMR